ncbi:MAG: hypothetical protein ACJ74J_15880 [Blastocatellia bacterium]
MNHESRPRAEVQSLVAHCQSARAAGASPEQIRAHILPEAIDSALSRLDAREFLDWVKEEREHAYFYYDAQQSGVCAKPREAAALILEQIAMDAIE